MEWGNLRNWLGSSPRERERDETRQLWQSVQAAWESSPLSTRPPPDLPLDYMREAMERAPQVPPIQLLAALCEATALALSEEPIGRIEPMWEAIDGDIKVGLGFRRVMRVRGRWSRDYERIRSLVGERFIGTFLSIFHALPMLLSTDSSDSEPFGVPFADLLEDPVAVISRILLIPYDDDILEWDLLRDFRETIERNVLVASGFSPGDDINERAERLVWPSEYKNRDALTLAETYLAGTGFAEALQVALPFHIPEATRFEHTHIVGGTGHGKTQLMQRMIHADLVAAQSDGRSVVVIDSQGDLINKLSRLALFDPGTPDSLAHRLVLIDPADVEYPAALNLFDAHLERLRNYRPVDRERVLNGVIELYETFFGAMLGAELTQKQGVIFRYLARLMVEIPGATIHTLMALMEDGKPYRRYMEALTGSARHFFQTEFFHPSFSATKKQILKRLWGVLSTPAFERMFAQESNKLDMFDALNSGKIILVSTAKDLLKQDGSALFGRFFIALINQATLERATVQAADRTPAFVYIDEAQEYFDESIETILNQARKYGVGLTLAHQALDQLSPRLRAVLFANTSIKCAGGVSAKDARALSDELHTHHDFIGSMRRRPERSEFAVWVKHLTTQAVRLSTPLGYLERQRTLTEEAFAELLDYNRIRYCGTLADVKDFSVAPASEMNEEGATEAGARREADASSEVTPRTDDDPSGGDGISLPHPRSPSVPTPGPSGSEAAGRPLPYASTASPRQDMGKGGPKHRYLQSLVKELAERHGFKATIEAPLPSGPGQVDVLLERPDLRVAIEVSVTTPAEYEKRNIRKCFDAGYAHVALVLAKSKRTGDRYRGIVLEGLSSDERERFSILAPEDLPDYVAGLALPPSPAETTVRGYRVRVARTSVSPGETRARREALARLMAKTLDRET